jgi:hypothetical protein
MFLLLLLLILIPLQFWFGMFLANKHTRGMNMKAQNDTQIKWNRCSSSFGGLEVACWPLVPTFVGSNPAEAVGFFRAKISPARLPSEGK